MKTANIKNIKTKAGIGKKRVENLKKAIKNRNRRLTSWTKRLYTDDSKSLKDRYAALARGQYLPGIISIDFDKITSVKDYNALMRMLNADKTKSWKQQRTSQMREWMKKAIDRSLMLYRNMDPELYERIDSMTDAEILQFRLEHPDLIKKVFEYYTDDSGINVDDRNEMWDSIRAGVGLLPKADKSTMMVML